MTDNAFLIELFYSYSFLSLGNTAQTAKTYSFYAKEFCKYLESLDIKLENVNEKIILQYLFESNKKELSPRTIQTCFTSLLSFGDFLVLKTIWSDNYFKSISRPKTTNRTLPFVLTLEEVNKLLSVINQNDYRGIRDYAAFELMYSCGLRAGELCDLELLNVHLEKHQIKVNGKGKKERIIPFGEYAYDALNAYLYIVRPIQSLKKNPNACFLSMYGHKLTNRTLEQRFNYYRDLAGINPLAHVHTLRHSFATHLLLGGANILAISKLMGHANIQTTMIYTHLHQELLEAAHHKYLPSA